MSGRRSPATVRTWITVVLLAAAGMVGAALWLTLPVGKLLPPQKLTLTEMPVTGLPGWSEGSFSGTLDAFGRSCEKWTKAKTPRTIRIDDRRWHGAVWETVCRQAGTVTAGDSDAARRFFETAFTAFHVRSDGDAEGLFTGYYEPIIDGSATRRSDSQVPLYAVPADLVRARLGDFHDEFKGRTITGRVKGRDIVPYYDRKAIDDGMLAERDLELVYVDDPVDAFFLHIQGSGRVRLQDGGEMRVGYAGQNGHRYYPIGRELIKRGALDKKTVSMQSIRQWLNAHPDRAAEVMQTNPSYIFFRILSSEGPLGAQGVALTPERSIAVDRRLYSYGLPVWVDMTSPLDENQRLRQLYIAQDTGGAIRGAVRGDVFWGAGEKAADIAGRMKQPGEWYILLPKAAEPIAPPASS